MEMQQLKTFCTIAKTQSFTKASELLDYAQSSISAQVRLLEEELHVKLFERMGRRVFLTQEGERFIGYAEKILTLTEEAKAAVNGSDSPKGTLTIGAPESICTYRLPKVLQEYRKRYPEVEIILKHGLSADLFSWIKSNEIDIAILMDRPLTTADLVVESLREETMTLISGVNHCLVHKAQTNSQDLQGEQIIVIEKGCCYRQLFETQLVEANVQPSSTLEIGSVEAVKKCVANNLGVSLLPQMAVEQELSLGILRDLNWTDLNFNIFTLMIYHKDKWLSPALKAFIELARQLLKQDLKTTY